MNRRTIEILWKTSLAAIVIITASMMILKRLSISTGDDVMKILCVIDLVAMFTMIFSARARAINEYNDRHKEKDGGQSDGTQ